MSDKRETFNEDYFLRGVETGLSNYTDYKWLDSTMQLAGSFMDHVGLELTDTVADFGCARGYFVKALRRYGIRAYGYDISRWAIDNGDPEIKDYLFLYNELLSRSCDWVYAKDVIEHVPEAILLETAMTLLHAARKGLFIIVPLTDSNGEYIRIEDRQDVTHQIRWELADWMKFLSECAPDFIVNGSYHIPGLKPASEKVPYSCGFFTLKRIAK